MKKKTYKALAEEILFELYKGYYRKEDEIEAIVKILKRVIKLKK